MSVTSRRLIRWPDARYGPAVANEPKARRAPAPELRQRDAERTRAALLDAALTEFAAKGLAGARVSEIAERAGVNKQLISYYFGGKDGLYQALVARWLEEEARFAGPELPLDEIVVQYLQANIRLRDIMRMFLWSGLTYDPAADPPEPGTDVPDDIADLRRRQAEGELADDLDPAFVLLLFMAAASVGITLPHKVKEVTGLEPTSDEFIERYGEQLRRIVRHLAAPRP
jgi:TetR/AcrR family transcriptional regulator